MESHLTFGPAQADATAMIVLLHGRGQSPDYIREQAAALMAPDVRCVLPAAPDGVWYPRRFMEPLADNEPFIVESLARIEAIVGNALASGLPAGRIVVLGFSQGGCLASEFARRFPRHYGAVVIWTGGLIGPPGTDWAVPQGLDGVPVLVTGSDVDEFIPEQRSRETGEHFAAAGARVNLRLYPGRPHIVSAPEVAAVADLIETIRHG